MTAERGFALSGPVLQLHDVSHEATDQRSPLPVSAPGPGDGVGQPEHWVSGWFLQVVPQQVDSLQPGTLRFDDPFIVDHQRFVTLQNERRPDVQAHQVTYQPSEDLLARGGLDPLPGDVDPRRD